LIILQVLLKMFTGKIKDAAEATPFVIKIQLI